MAPYALYDDGFSKRKSSVHVPSYYFHAQMYIDKGTGEEMPVGVALTACVKLLSSILLCLAL